MSKRFDKSRVIALLRDAVMAAGSQRKFAQIHGLSNTQISDALRNRGEPGEGVLKALGLRRVVSYERE